jgi:dihydrofolate reductase
MSRGPRVSLIAAMSANQVIGRDNRLPWHLPADLQRFKQLTMGHTIVMGRKTWESIGRLLPGRRTVVVSRDASLRIEGARVVHSLEQALAESAGDEEIFVIGGEQIFRLALPLAHRVYLTIVEIEVAGDTFMPPLDPAHWRKMSAESHAATGDGKPAWRFEIHDRIPRHDDRP